MQPNQLDAITLVVTNSEQLEGRSTSSFVFYNEGGTLGSSTHDDWLLQDHGGRIRSSHAEITKIDGKFCLIDLSGHTFINRTTLPIGRNRKVALRDGDELLIGEYRLKVHLGDRHSWQPGVHSLATLIDEEHDEVTTHGAAWPTERGNTFSHEAEKGDPMEALGGALPGSIQHDPMVALDREEKSSYPMESLEAMALSERKHTYSGHVSQERSYQERSFQSPSSQNQSFKKPSFRRSPSFQDRSFEDNRGPQQERHDELLSLPVARTPNGKTNYETSIYETTAQRSSGMDERQINDLERSVGEQLEDRWQKPTTQSLGHVGADPLLRGLGLDLSFRDSEEQQAFLEEAGHTLRATIDGLRLLQQAQNDTKYPLRDRRLQPIEDNPLRLGQSYEETAETMFSAQRSPVHLSAPEAVAECLRHQGQHQAAVEEAIGHALGAILDAFSPEALLKRFHAYRGAGNRIEDEGGWAWEMYHYYYRELNSGRQQGFQKLFWEVFEQAYDQSVRKQQREEA
ncbi:type VI secretion system-associated FHA domain protein TagH [Halomonas sp. M1]|uniref:type VI secretion system-associated FHA domain protein TagH n=1 Tax=Halomonas sp. M1 TaxID=3035470 RepID=UPI002486105A|nr:type VI secretion system-associated FHA domain protein TagH [Halomonas sp. M1]WFE70787.1 type VI secretion system-associated FHA domain protein TagH [Halomonas sp. M1]